MVPGLMTRIIEKNMTRLGEAGGSAYSVCHEWLAERGRPRLPVGRDLRTSPSSGQAAGKLQLSI